MSEAIIAVGPDLPSKLGEALRAAFHDDDYDLLVEQLQLAIGNVVTGLVVYGTMANPSRSREIGESDVDMLVLVREAASGGVFGRADGIEIDLHVQSRDETLSAPNTNWIYAEGRVLFDARPPELASWLKDLSNWKRENSNPWTEADHLRGRVWAQRLVERVIRLGPIDPTVAAMHEARVLATIPTLHAQVHRRHTISISQWWSALTVDDPPFVRALTWYIATRSFPPDGHALKRLIDELYAPAGSAGHATPTRSRF